MSILTVEDLVVSYGGVRALDGVGLRVEAGTIEGIIGPNGSGKTTLVNAIMGAVRTRAGTIEFDGHQLARVPVHGRRRLGLARTFQNLSLSEALTVEENLRIGGHSLGLRGKELAAELRDVAELFGIASVLGREVVVLPYGVRKYVELARAFIGRPKLVVLDEAAAGLNSHAKARLAELLRVAVGDGGTSLIVIEHDLDFLGQLVDSATVLTDGHVVTSGTLEEVVRNEMVREAYLGAARTTADPGQDTTDPAPPQRSPRSPRSETQSS